MNAARINKLTKLMIFMIVFLFSSCSTENKTDIDEFSSQVFIYYNTRDSDSLNNVICKKCPDNFYDYMNNSRLKINKLFIEKYNVSLGGKESYNFEKIQCNYDKSNKIYSVTCNGNMSISDNDDKIIYSRNMEKIFHVLEKNNKFYVCPKVCQ